MPHPFFNEFGRALRPVYAFRFEFLAPALVVGDEELRYLIHQIPVHLADRGEIRMVIGMESHSEEPVVGGSLGALDLLRLHHTDQSHVQQASDVRRLVHKDHHVQGIAVIPQGPGNKTKVEGKSHSLRQKSTQRKELIIGIVIEFVSPALGCLDNGFALAFLAVPLIRNGGKIHSRLTTSSACEESWRPLSALRSVRWRWPVY